ncbi:acyl-CoA thioesterase [Pseudomonas cannabina]|uniref:Thioesterase family protein n=3 Tax=Pseudomonas syringae group TaxID=136849 RepID=A0A8T8BZ42_PSEYM|nr:MULTISPECIES: thioesterase family protein [Pseudomonas syringae group]KPB77801.1 Acyl-CoA thioesterase II [Pseudomonas syringae pv. maculicola]MBM0141046.1 thioesterase family protein [Pseudomonas cannabina pv. alisalensis]QHE96700.1 thioesterase family protein [Pseudomonas syringae pv. maculicola str. ES4326]QQN20246.1 thioesterase family protein [Pseudomonas cannabina pv. alisalensis]RMN76722.1 putative Acyl-CoA thioesterase II [Pseudomonas cannabina pv. alisalensis]
MTFSELIDAGRDHPRSVTIPAEWSQGRACFGGLMAALTYEAMRAQVPEGRPVRSLAITFVGPAAPGVPIAFEVEVLRHGKAVSQVVGRAVQNGEVMTLIQGSFGAPRESVIAVAAEPAPDLKPVEDCPELPFVSGVMPDYLRFMDIRWALGGMPFSNTRSPAIGGYVRLRDEQHARPMSEAHILALVDTWPPAVLPHLDTPAPGSSRTWTIEFVQPQPALDTLQWCSYRAVIEHARDGYGHTAAALWSPQGELIAISRQTVTVFG